MIINNKTKFRNGEKQAHVSEIHFDNSIKYFMTKP